MMPSALDDLLIVDFSRVLAGPMATMVLADLGATVVKVERPGVGDDTRAWGPPYAADGTTSYFLSVNRNKGSVALDLRDPQDLASARELISRADVVVENFRPGVMDGLGLGYEQLSTADPALVYCSITGFGRAGGAEIPGYDLLVQAVGGLMSITGAPDGEPQKVGVALVDVVCGLFAATGILAAVRHRERTGIGQRVDIDLLSSLLAGLANQASAVTTAGAAPARLGNAHPSIAPYELFATRDGDLVLAVGNDRQFARLCSVIGADALATDERFVRNDVRVEHRVALKRELERRLVHAPAVVWADRLTGAGVPAGEVNDVAGGIAMAERLGLAPTVDVPRPDGSTVALIRNPLTLSATPATYRTAPPTLGQNRDLVEGPRASDQRSDATS